MQRKPHLTEALVAGCLTVAAGCQTESAPAPDLVYETRDSAGIPIAVSTGFPSPEDSWVVEVEPFLSIGGASADPLAMFNIVTQATRFSDGRIAILESEASELRFFDSGGRHLRTAGGRGEGPGEFQYAATFVRLPGDTLLVDAGDRHILPPPMGPAPATPETPDLVPAAFGLTVGMRGDVWVRRAPLPGTRDATVFDAFDRDGRFRGEIRFDGYFWLYEVGDDYLLGARLDELDIPRIQLHRLHRGQDVTRS